MKLQGRDNAWTLFTANAQSSVFLDVWGDWSMSTLFVNNLNTASGTTIQVASGKTIIRLPVLQVQSGQTDTQLTKSNVFWYYIYRCWIICNTPKFNNSQIYVIAI